MDLHTLLKSFFNSINSLAEYDILDVSIFIWLLLSAGLFLVFAALEKKMR